MELTAFELKIDLFVVKKAPKTSLLTMKIVHLDQFFVQISKMVRKCIYFAKNSRKMFFLVTNCKSEMICTSNMPSDSPKN